MSCVRVPSPSQLSLFKIVHIKKQELKPSPTLKPVESGLAEVVAAKASAKAIMGTFIGFLFVPDVCSGAVRLWPKNFENSACLTANFWRSTFFSLHEKPFDLRLSISRIPPQFLSLHFTDVSRINYTQCLDSLVPSTGSRSRPARS